MKSFFIIVLMTGFVSAQTIYKVIPGTKDNKIILTVENASTETEMTDIKAWILKPLSALNFQLPEQTIDKIEKQNSKDVEFIFDVDRTADVNKTDTLMFVINSRLGNWAKEILIGYELPVDFKLEQNYPNPFNPTTTIEFSIPKEGKYLLRVYNILGQVVKTLVDKNIEAGYHKLIFDAGELSSGVYFYSLIGTDVNLVKKMIVMR